MKRINPETNKPFKRGFVREDGFTFNCYQKTIKKDGFYQELWNSPESLKKIKESNVYRRSIKTKITPELKRNNPETNKPFKWGDIREDGYKFKCYSNPLKKDGYLTEVWSNPKSWKKMSKNVLKARRKSYIKYNPKIHTRRINPKTNKEFKIGDMDEKGRYFLHYQSEIHHNKTEMPERWVDSYEKYLKYYFNRTLSKIRQKCKKKNLPLDIDSTYLVSIFPKDKLCPALKIEMDFGGDKLERFNSPSVDRIIPEKGYVKGNVRFVSYLANAIMNDANADEILKVGNWLKEQNVIRHKDR
jgi:hypothetical protein